MGRLTVTSIKAALKKPGRHGDGDGLFLQVGTGGAASWVVRVQKDGRRRDIGLGSEKKISLTVARERASAARTDMELGVDPVAKRKKAAGIPTFREASSQFIAEHQKTWRNAKHGKQWRTTLESYAFPSIGDTSVSEVEAPAIRDLLITIWVDKPETARRVKQRIGAVLDWAHAKGYRDAEAPMRAIGKGLPRQKKQASHFAAMPYADVPAFLIKLRERQSWGRLALEAAIHTAARSGEIRGATWAEVDLENGLWTIPAERMKAKREHVVPLSKAALDVFKRAAALKTAGHKFVFNGSKRDKPMSDMTLTKVLRDMKRPVTAHGFRSSFRDWVSEETDFPGDVAEAALAHAVSNKTEAAYRRGNLLDKRRKLMEAWGSYCNGLRASVVRIVA
ncbi:MAG TPA: tyrosine-type recombinase/integrase [Hyphomicrobiaceae bacterium]|nr:tyrosine-type recombinase/integrase [Hyphomicrobiaceae bacterium]